MRSHQGCRMHRVRSVRRSCGLLWHRRSGRTPAADAVPPKKQRRWRAGRSGWHAGWPPAVQQHQAQNCPQGRSGRSAPLLYFQPAPGCPAAGGRRRTDHAASLHTGHPGPETAGRPCRYCCRLHSRCRPAWSSCCPAVWQAWYGPCSERLTSWSCVQRSEPDDRLPLDQRISVVLLP